MVPNDSIKNGPIAMLHDPDLLAFVGEASRFSEDEETFLSRFAPQKIQLSDALGDCLVCSALPGLAAGLRWAWRYIAG